jgi:mutator protein MutT
MNLRLNANAIVTNNNGEILLIELKKGPYAGGICIPGGGIEPGEKAINAVKREIKEETGIEINKIKPLGFCELIHEGKEVHRLVILLHALAEGTPLETEEGRAFWARYEDVGEKLIPFAKESIKMWEEGRNYFALIGDETGITWNWKN